MLVRRFSFEAAAAVGALVLFVGGFWEIGVTIQFLSGPWLWAAKVGRVVTLAGAVGTIVGEASNIWDWYKGSTDLERRDFIFDDSYMIAMLDHEHLSVTKSRWGDNEIHTLQPELADIFLDMWNHTMKEFTHGLTHFSISFTNHSSNTVKWDLNLPTDIEVSVNFVYTHPNGIIATSASVNSTQEAMESLYDHLSGNKILKKKSITADWVSYVANCNKATHTLLFKNQPDFLADKIRDNVFFQVSSNHTCFHTSCYKYPLKGILSSKNTTLSKKELSHAGHFFVGSYSGADENSGSKRRFQT